jgi:hypothetical protein
VTTKTAFTDDEWTAILEGPTSAGMLVITASKGGMFKETFAESKAYVEARAQHDQTELLAAILATKPKSDHTHYHSPEALREGALAHLTKAITVLAAKATPEELAAYRSFVLTLCTKVADAHKEGGDAATSPAETEAIAAVTAALGTA